MIFRFFLNASTAAPVDLPYGLRVQFLLVDRELVDEDQRGLDLRHEFTLDAQREMRAIFDETGFEPLVTGEGG
jgi:hypothetical protein